MVNRAAINMNVQGLSGGLNYSGTKSRNGTAGSFSISHFKFCRGTSILNSILAELVDISTSSSEGSSAMPFLPTFVVVFLSDILTGVG